ncbi:TonB-dependent receptor [Massilia endophytica]|uniref:TonB-dependent receptor n=1 Tax=Massilia endophytica TaxID=2899220 RepID=UPI001E3EBE75|nr:TonB-dependent receptor [Massilia endophytica]UGQ47351.1 TonB-dependent receptor [Massilia endophytica]
MLNKKTLVRALSLAFAGAALSAAMVQPVMAQSNATGNIVGKSTAGASISVVGVDNGLKRTITPDANGDFRITSLPVGNYKVSLMQGGTATNTQDVEVRIGQESEVVLQVASVTVSQRRKTIDMGSSNSGSSFNARELAALPLAPEVTNIVQLAGGTTRADSRYGNNAASFGGSSASENAAYINGFPVTNSLYQVGYSSLPFGSIAEAQIITGGYGAEFGRSTGGVVNITTKSGNNNWEMGVGVNWAPNSLRAKSRNIMHPRTGAPENAATDGTIYNYKAGDVLTEKMYNAFISGPIFKDRLFVYLGAEYNDVHRETARLASTNTVNGQTGWGVQNQRVPRYLAKVDWNITDNHRLEYTRIADESKVEEKYYGFDYATLKHNNVVGGGASYLNYAAGVLGLGGTGAALQAPQGANLNILKYTGYVTDDLTVQALVGKARTDRVQDPLGYVPGLRPISAPPANQVKGLNYTPSQVQGFSSPLLREGAHDENKGYRFDVEYKLTKQHTLRGGLDHNKITALNGSVSAGGGTWFYLRANDPNAVLSGHNISPAAGGGYGTGGYYVRENIQRGGSTPAVKQAAQYLEDRYQVNDNLVVTLGLRNESFENMNGAGDVFVEQKDMLAPRLNVAWNVHGDGSLKVFGTAGRYFMQLPANMAVRFAGAALNTDRFYTYTGVDAATGAPTGLNPISNVLSANNEFGQEKRAKELAAQGLKAHYQDEINLGFEKALTPDYNGGIKFTYRTLRNSIDDYSDPRAIAAKLNGAERDYFLSTWTGALFNPGKDNTFLVPTGPNGQARSVHVTAAEIGFPDDVKREYTALEFMLEHPLRNGWYGKANYTWSRSYGNQEGQTKSDNAQPDVGFTSGWDFPETMINATGLLPNNRTHQLKAYGYYELNKELALGGNLLVATGRPMSRTCNIPSAMDQEGLGLSQYGSVFFLCPTGPNGRGALGRLPTDTRVDLNLTYKPQLLSGLMLKMDVLNVFNKQVAQRIDEGQNVAAAGDTISPTASMVSAYSPARSVRLSAQYSYKF